MNRHERIEAIDALLPQTQCERCEYPGCLPYAEAIADGDAINKCPPGGEKLIGQLAQLLDVPTVPLDTRHGEPGPRKLAFIREAECIGCTKCIQVCPTDAIVGAAKLMHTVIESECTGCELCIEPCPVDCIDMIAPDSGINTQNDNGEISAEQSRYWRERYQNREKRLQMQAETLGQVRKERLLARQQTPTPTDNDQPPSKADLQSDIRAAVARSKARKAANKKN